MTVTRDIDMVGTTDPLTGTLNRGRLISGISKLVQSVVIELLTESDSFASDPQRGTNFLLDLRLRRFANESAILARFAAARIRLLRNLKSRVTATTPAEEKIKDVTVERIVIGNGVLLLHLQVVSEATTVAGTSVSLDLTL